MQPQIIDRYTTLLQSGIRLPSTTGTSIGLFLDALPGFDMQYLSERVQTIFFDGSAIDDLDKTFHSSSHTLALSAAMPGLAGAIFRKNSLCGTLRTTKDATAEADTTARQSIIHLKLFNMIAREKGEDLLRHGGYFSGSSLIDFFSQRPSLLETLDDCTVDGAPRDPKKLLLQLQPEPFYHLSICTSNKG